MSSTRPQHTARLLLDRVAESDRASVVRHVAQSLSAQSAKADFGLAATLLQLQADRETEEILLRHLLAFIQGGDVDHAVAICLEHPTLGASIYSRLLVDISAASITLQASGLGLISVPVPGSGRTLVTEDEESLERLVETTILNYQFVNRTTPQNFQSTSTDPLFQASLALLGASEKRLSDQAQEALFFHISFQLTAQQQEILWQRIQSLIESTEAVYHTLGFSLWMRWVSSATQVDAQYLKEPQYWDALVRGLRTGDSERRKSCLQILRSSVDAVVEDASLLPIITSTLSKSESASSVQKQYVRFCTVFETIILGRYLNQVQECEPDLDFLLSETSVVKPVFLYTLLAIALDQGMQDSNRKFIGTWIMRSNLRTDDVDSFMSFFQSAFLPWATQGYLFTSSLRQHHRMLRCDHGDRVADFVANLLQAQPGLMHRVMNSFVSSILARHGNNFSYAPVYLLEGFSKALENDSNLVVDPEHLEKIYQIASWIGLPEIAKDYMLARTWKLCFDRQKGELEAPPTEFIISALANWQRLVKKSQALDTHSTVQREDSIASLALPPSKRDANESIARQKCIALQTDSTPTKSETDAMQLEDRLEDIWSDLEYLEYPKGLLCTLSQCILCKDLIQAATKSYRLADVVAKRTQDLLELAVNKSYMLSPLVKGLRSATLSQPEAVSLLHLDKLVMFIVEHPPTATVDGILEDVTSTLLQSIHPELAIFKYEYYFGERESYGFAALLDLVSRLRSIEPESVKVIFETILQRWKRQKLPPPSVCAWKKVLQLQILLLCSEQHVPFLDAVAAKQVVKDLNHIISVEPLPRYRYLLEWMLARIYIHHPQLRRILLEELQTKDHHSNPKFLASLMKVGVMIAKTKSSDEEFALQLMTVFVPLSASSKVIIRHEAQWQVPILMDHARDQNWTTITGNSASVALDDFIRSLERFSDPPVERQIDRLDPVHNNNLTHLVEGAWHDLDNVEPRHSTRADFLSLYASDGEERLTLPGSCIPLGDPLPTHQSKSSSQQHQIDYERRMLQNIDNISRALGSAPGPTALQTKGAAYLDSTQNRHTNLFVVASLVDNPYNLGGLSRVSEIFGAAALFVGNPQVTSHKDFTSVSVSSHQHIPIEALSAKDVGAFLVRKKREEGFSVVGIEQTDRSVLLGDEGCVLPEKCVLVIGSEREGIPALVLSECDVLVEIRQVGVTRSLNVQTAAAIVLCEYAKQRKK